MSLMNSITAYYGKLLPLSTSYGLDPETLDEFWNSLTDGRDMLRLWLYDAAGNDDRAVLPDALNKLFDDFLELPTNKSGTQTLRADLIDQFGWGAYKNMKAGTAEPMRPVDPQPKVQDLWRVAMQFYWANRGVVPTWFRLNGIVASIRNWYHSLPGAYGVSYFDRWLADAIRHRQPDSPLSWLPAARFGVGVTIDYPTDEPFEKHAPAGWWSSEPEPSELRYLAKEEDDPARSVWAEALVVEYYKDLSFDEFAAFAVERRLILSQSIPEARHYFRTDLKYNPWSIPPVDMVDRGYYDPSVPSHRRVDVDMQVYIHVLPDGAPPPSYTVEQAQEMVDELKAYIESHWSLRA